MKGDRLARVRIVHILLIALAGIGVLILGCSILIRGAQEQSVGVTMHVPEGSHGTPISHSGGSPAVKRWDRRSEIIAFGWFLMILAIGALSARDPSEVKSRYHFCVFGLSVPALAFVLAFARDAYVSQIEPGLREHIAGMCIVGTFALSACTHDSSMNTIRRHLVRDIQYALTKVPPWAACSVFLGVLAFGCCHQWKSSGDEPFEEWFARQPSIPIQQLRGHEAVVVVQFRDYQCGPCKAARQEQEPVMRNLQRHYPNEIRFVTMDFPLERECNRFAAVDIHPAACEAAVAVGLAEAQGLREEMERWLWEHQDVYWTQIVSNRLPGRSVE